MRDCRAGTFVARGLAVIVWLASSLASCKSEPPTALETPAIELAKSGGTGDPTVTSATPSSATPDTTLDVAVGGSGFDRGSRVDMALDGIVTEKVLTNSTTYVSSTKLIANITIAAEAVEDLYDVLVTTSRGKRGIGTELFAVTKVTTTDLGMLPRSAGAMAMGINATGEVTGPSWPRRGPTHAFVWIAGTMHDLGEGFPLDISDDGSVVGDDGRSTRAVVWERTGGTSWSRVELPSLPTGPYVVQEGLAISPLGDKAVGRSMGLPVLWTRGAQGWSAQELPSTGTGVALDINAGEEIVGTTWSPTGAGRAVVWLPNSTGSYDFTYLGEPGGFSGSDAWAINETGQVAGYSTDGAGLPRALLWTRAGSSWGVQVIADGQALGLSNRGQVVGCEGAETPPTQQAWVWTSAGGLQLLGRECARDINDSNQVVGESGLGRAVMWTLP